MKDKNLEERIDNFLNGGQDENLLKDIQRSIEKDQELKKTLGDHVNANILLKRIGERSLKEKLTQQLQSTGPDQPPEERSSWIKWMLLIVALGIIAVLSIMVLPSNNNNISDQFAYKDPSVPNLRSIGIGQQTDSWKEALSYFEQKEYECALYQLEQLEPNGIILQNHKDNYNLILGVCLLRLNKSDEAQKSLEKITPSSPYFDQSLWYQFLCAYHQKDNDKVSLLLNKIKGYTNHYRVNQAIQLSDNLNK